jgi:predicted methyltransferase
VLDRQAEDVQARYEYRHPKATLEFFGIEPGMTVVEGLPGRGWYTQILLPYLGKEGHLIGANYAMDMWPNFAFANEEFLRTQSTWVTDWPVGCRNR